MLSDLLRFKLLDRRGRQARIVDVAVDVASSTYPPLARLIIRLPGKQQRELAWTDLSVDWVHRTVRVSNLEMGPLAPPEALRRTVLLKRDIVDALLIDLKGRATARANDLWLRPQGDAAELRAVDISPWAVLRRLGRGVLGRGTERHLLDWNDVEFLRGDPMGALDGRDYHHQVARLQPGEIANLLDALPYLHAAELLSLLPLHLAADTLEEMGSARQVQVLEELQEDHAIKLLARIAPESAADLLGRLGSAEATLFLQGLPQAAGERVIELLRYPEDTAGGIMTNLVPTVPASITIADARETLKTELKLPDFIYYVFALEDLESERLCGVVTLRQLLTADPDATVRSIMREDLETAEPLAPAITVARQLLDAHLAALPVVAADGRLLGAVTIDAALQQVAPRSMRDEAPRIFS